ncbi:MAG TPA: NAD(P)-dependent oxidoreductase [Kofleriaceae bacterium]|nr:NAD(P)-dependent oxidoreductase [Kofleriaceae bacterium]
MDLGSQRARSGASDEPRDATRAPVSTDPRLYPVFLRLGGLPVVVVGGGAVAAGKLDGLLEAGARVTVIAPVICEAIRARAAGQPRDATIDPRSIDHRLALVHRGFTASDLDGARWVVAAATPEVNREVAAAATARGLFVNAVDDVASASAYLGGVIRRGPAVVAISTGGLAPALAGLVREALDALLPHDLERWVDVARAARAGWKRAGTPIAARRPLLLRALAVLYRGDQAAEPPELPLDERSEATAGGGSAGGTGSGVPRGINLPLEVAS